MSDARRRIEDKLITNIFISWCNEKKEEEKIEFEHSFASNSKVRFSTKVISSIFKPLNDNKGYWKNGYSIYYEIEANENGINISLLSSGLLVSDKDKYYSFLATNGIVNEKDNISIIKTWNVLPANAKTELIYNALNNVLLNDISKYEIELKKWIKNHNYKIIDGEFYIEGAQKQVTSNTFERNISARKKCIEVNGAYCHICGFDYGKVYGKEFANKIEVHHIVPLSEIRKDYEVDPVHDLIPVCSNCHMILHSKKDGVYTPDEVKNMLNKK